jgi:glycosyltransferase involved in cell wall biosynthesis
MSSTLALLIPAYNAASYLPRLLESAVRQCRPFDEIWVYDDCSTDNTAEVAERHGVRVIRGDVNRGCTHGKSVLVERTKCEWVHFHDADDLLLPEFMATALSWMSRDNVDVVTFACEERWEDTDKFISLSIPNDQSLRSDPIGYNIRNNINAISSIYRRGAFLSAGGFDLDPAVLYNEDRACHCKLARAGLRFRGDPTVTVVNLRRRSSMWTSNKAKCHKAHYYVMCKALAGLDGDRHKEAIAERLWHVVAGAASELDWCTADMAAALAMQIAGPSLAPSGSGFKALCCFSPRLAIRFREGLIRVFKPRLRAGYPGWRAQLRNEHDPTAASI